MFARAAAAVAVLAGGMLAGTGTSGAAEAAPAPVVAAPAAVADDPCGYWRAGNWLSGYTYWYRHCGSTYVWVHISYYDNTYDSSCFSPWEKRQLSWRTTNAYYTGLC
ncbi:DUF6355 family natural product biosynthesis protein [Actinokineospora auranticolor]|uniref:Peptidase inhibitor family I36 n=1 Tax=Actinokineospora auranticolor TaxID=155976 RepID=A0A2S6GF35_9PSEU|nr:DUF6355 family natural product biosynthesis protein [Actinokineospora auranticolor]PPK63844.1 hypothetical protein CLV40_12488 [Actinokineospora auranticolor]